VPKKKRKWPSLNKNFYIKREKRGKATGKKLRRDRYFKGSTALFTGRIDGCTEITGEREASNSNVSKKTDEGRVVPFSKG